MNEKPKIAIELEPGDYLVSLHTAYEPRIWKIRSTGEISGMGRTLKRVAVSQALSELTIAAEEDEGLGDVPRITSAKKKFR